MGSIESARTADPFVAGAMPQLPDRSELAPKTVSEERSPVPGLVVGGGIGLLGSGLLVRALASHEGVGALRTASRPGIGIAIAAAALGGAAVGAFAWGGTRDRVVSPEEQLREAAAARSSDPAFQRADDYEDVLGRGWTHHGMTVDEYAEAAFQLYDANDDGGVDVATESGRATVTGNTASFETLFQRADSLGDGDHVATPEEIRRVVAAFDADRDGIPADGVLDASERALLDQSFAEFVPGESPPRVTDVAVDELSADQAAITLVQRLDSDYDGAIALDSELGSLESQTASVLSEADADGDGAVDFGELRSELEDARGSSIFAPQVLGSGDAP